MAAVPQKVLNWLYSVLTSEYHNVNRTYSDIAQTLASYPTFSPRTDVYTHESGQPSLLLILNGTLPVSFRGTTYMFPVAIWVPHAYPRESPIIYVTPTKDMAVRPGQYVSGEGRVYHPYLASWREDRSSMADMLSVLQQIFAREPPVLAKEQTRRPQLQQNEAPPPVPPLPPEIRRSDTRASPPSPQPVSRNSPPPPPPKPHDGWGRPQDPHVNGAPPVPPHPSASNNGYGPPAEERRNSYQRAPLHMPQYAPQRSSSLRNGYDAAMMPEHQRDRQGLRQGPHTPNSPISPSIQQTGYPPNPAQTFQPRYHDQAAQPSPLPASTQQPNPGYQTHPSTHHQQRSPQPQTYPPYHNQQPTPQNPTQPAKPAPPTDLLTSPSETPLPTTQPAHLPAPPIPPTPKKTPSSPPSPEP
ncbi:MAG: UEV domain-containing [Lasallia pustulata]|uniref:UEV domain-containing n=1 Tax=Lasallia pustulata TaxID=136370 RepID=A0A5M8PFC6_9LECA|nr:MAG: UEV domain-containing [Lasallia pustulata]